MFKCIFFECLEYRDIIVIQLVLGMRRLIISRFQMVFESRVLLYLTEKAAYSIGFQIYNIHVSDKRAYIYIVTSTQRINVQIILYIDLICAYNCTKCIVCVKEDLGIRF